MFRFSDLIESALSTWRLTHMLMYERGPYDCFTFIRTSAGIEHDEDKNPISWPDNHVLSCFLCLSVWTTLWLSPPAVQAARRVLAVSGLAILMDKYYGQG